MTVRRVVFLVAVFAAACLTIVGMNAQGQGGVAAAGAPAAQGGGRMGGAAPVVQPKGTLTPLKVDERGEGWMVKSYIDPKHLPLYNIAKQDLLDQKQVTSRTISRLDPEAYCEARKHWDFIWFEMQHSTMTWADMEKMIAACPGFGPGVGQGAPMIRMPDALEANMQKGGDLGALGFIVPTMPDAVIARDAARFARYPPVGRRSTGAGQAASIWGGSGRTPGAPLIAAAPQLNYQETINDNMLVVVMIETVEGVINANEIANVYGLDVVIEGNNDLSRFSGYSQNDDRYEDLKIRVHDAALKAGKFYGAAGQQYLTGNILSPDTRLVQDGPAKDGYVPPARGRGPAQPAEPTYGVPGGSSGTPTPGAAPAGGGRGRRGGGAATPQP